MKKNTPGLVVASSLVGLGLYADKLLVDHGYWTISSSIRRSRIARSLVFYFTFHFSIESDYDPGKRLFLYYVSRKSRNQLAMVVE